MDANLPVLYPNCGILPFCSMSVNQAEYPEMSPTARGLTSCPYHHDSQNGKMSLYDLNERHASDKNTFICPRCSSCCSENVNWCFDCGELLIGARDCSPRERNCKENHLSLNFSCTLQKDNIANANGFSRNMSSSIPAAFHLSYGKDIQFPNLTSYSRHSLLSGSETPFAGASYPTLSAFPSGSLETQSTKWDDFSFSLPKHTEPECNTTKTNNSLCIPVEHLRTTFNHLGVTPAISTEQAQYGARVNGDYVNSANACNFNANFCPRKNGLLEPSVWNSRNYNNNARHSQLSCPFDMVSDNRQRRTSGPTKPFEVTSTQNSITNICHPNSVPSSYCLISHNSPINLSNSASQSVCTLSKNSWHESSASQVVANLLHETQISLSTNNSIPSKSSMCYVRPYQDLVPSISESPPTSHKGSHSRGGFCRRKHPSECSRTNSHYQNLGMYRARSFCSDFKDVDVNPTKCQPHHNWRSSRIAWSAHDPAVLKKKSAAYLRASYSQGNVASDQFESNTNMKQSKSNTQSDTSQRLPVSCANSSAFSQRGESSNNTLKSSIHNRSEWVDKYSKLSRSHPTRRNRGHLSKSLSICMDSTEITDSVANLPKEAIPLNFHADLVNKTELVPNWLLLPDELWLEILRLVSPVDRVRVAQTCRHLSRLSMDHSLWRVIHLHRQRNLTDADLVRIGNLKPRELRFTYCRGDSLTASGLKRMFLVCGPGLQKLSLIGCTKGPFDHDLPLRLVADHCHNLKHVNASYTQAVRDQTVIALAKSATHLISVKLNGAQQISNAAIQQLVHYHQRTLERLELFGCFRLNSSIFALLGRCQELRALAFGHLHHLSSDGLLELVSKLPHLSSLDLRGTQTFSDDGNLSQLAAKCPHLEEVVLANMHSLKRETGIAQMLRLLPRLRVLDLCGLAAVGDLTMEVLATSCPQLEELDVSCTSVTQKGLFHLTNAPAVCLKCLRISHCREITSDVLEKLITACPKLTLLYAYGFVSIDDWGFLQKIRPTLLVERGI